MKRTSLFIGGVLLLLLSGSLHALELSPEEQAFVEAHPTVSVAMMSNYPPFTSRQDGAGAGFEHDLLALVSQQTGLEFRKVFGLWSETLGRFRDGETDMISSISFREERTPYTLYTEPYYEIPIFVFVRDDFGPYRGLGDLAGRRVGIIRDIFYEQDLRDAGGMELVTFDTYQQMTRALVLGKIDALVQNLSNINHIIKRRAYTNLRIAGEVELPGLAREDLRFGIDPDKPELRSIVQKALDAISPAQWQALTDEWLDVRDNAEDTGIGLTPEERAYLDNRGRIDICLDPNWMPFERFDENGEYEGISADYFALFEKALATEFRPVRTRNWTESVEFLKAGECDLFTLAMRTPERDEYLEFTDSYIETPLVIATQTDVAYVNGLDDLQGKKVAIPRLYAFSELLRTDFPNLEIIEVDDIDAGLEMVRRGEVFGYIGTLATIGYKFQTRYTGELKISGDTRRSWDMGVAVREDDPLLYGIMQKAVASIAEEQKRAITNKWISIRYEEHVDYTLLWQVIAFFVLVLLAGLFFYLKQAGLRRQLEEAYEQAERLAVTDKLTGIYNRHKLDQALEEETERAERYGDGFGVLILDIDHFKRINDRFGHRSGDTVLREFVDVLRQNSRKTDLLGRWGGEEFMIVAPHADEATLLRLAEKLRSAVAEHAFSEASRVTTSIGASVYHPGDSPDSLVKRADDALYQSKQAGRNRSTFE